MPKQLDLMKLREARIGELLSTAQKKSKDFSTPPLIVIGGYALRAQVPFARYSRDCDFAIPKQPDAWAIDKIPKWFPELSTESKEKKERSGYLRLIQALVAGKNRIKVSLDFMEGEVVDRSEERIQIDDSFVSRSITAPIKVAGEEIEIRVPAYEDYLLLKLLSARPSDVRDIAALIWRNGTPDASSLITRAREIVSNPVHIGTNLGMVIKEVSDPRFIDSWRGTFISEEFSEADNRRVIAALKGMRAAFG